MNTVVNAARLDADMDKEAIWEIMARVRDAGNKEYPGKFSLYCMSIKARMRWGLNRQIITQEEHDAVKEFYKADDYWQWEYAE